MICNDPQRRDSLTIPNQRYRSNGNAARVPVSTDLIYAREEKQRCARRGSLFRSYRDPLLRFHAQFASPPSNPPINPDILCLINTSRAREIPRSRVLGIIPRRYPAATRPDRNEPRAPFTPSRKRDRVLAGKIRAGSGNDPTFSLSGSVRPDGKTRIINPRN